MKFVEPSVAYWKQEEGLTGVWKQIARATRVCYQSKPREGESDENFVKRIILKPALLEGNLDDLTTCRFNFDKMHGAMLEHGTLYLSIPKSELITRDFDMLWKNPFSKGFQIATYHSPNIGAYITTNVRALLELGLLPYYLKYVTEPTNNHIKRYTFSVITDIGVS